MSAHPRHLALLLLLGCVVCAQQSSQTALTIEQAVSRAGQFPSITAAQEQVNAAAAGIRLARTSYLPSVNAMGQVNRATRNNVFGLLLPQTVIPNMSGPVLGANNTTTVWGSAAGVLVSWEPFDFGRRRALVRSAEAAQNRSAFSAERTRFEIQTSTAAAFLTLLASEQTVRVAQASIDRAQIIIQSVKALVDAKLRPGADLSRADTELDAAMTELMQAQQARDVAKTAVAEFTGADTRTFRASPGHLLERLPEAQVNTLADLSANPAAKEQAAVIAELKSKLDVLQHTYRPTFDLQAAAYGRGSGALTNGQTLDGAGGLAPNYFNLGVGFTVTFPLLNLPSIRAQEAQAAALERSAAATYKQVLADLQAQSKAAQSTIDQARQIAAETPKEVEDARTGFAQANAQYRAGLATIVALAEAERLLAQAEIDDSLAKLAVWRAWLQLQTAQGDISSFLKEASR
ncbi:MAG: TolC family protein [Acidobacteriaceae bacterium]|nr:TolC family protein [Acidobacteriaceae bacterium]